MLPYSAKFLLSASVACLLVSACIGDSPSDATGAAGAGGATCTEEGSTQPCSVDANGAMIVFPGGTVKGICKQGVRACEMIDGQLQFGPCKGAVGPGKRDCASKQDNDCDGKPDDTKDVVCECSPSDDTTCIGPPPGNCKGVRQCQNAGASSKWSACNAPTECACTGDQDCTVYKCKGVQKCSNGKLGNCVSKSNNALELLSTCECEPGASVACKDVGGSKSCGMASCGLDQKASTASCTAPLTCYVDADGDTLGASYKPTMAACGSCPSSYTTVPGDCDDGSSSFKKNGDACTSNQGSLGSCPGTAQCPGTADKAATCKPTGCTSNAGCTLCSGSEVGIRTCGAGCSLGDCAGNVNRYYAGAGATSDCPGAAPSGGPSGSLVVDNATLQCQSYRDEYLPKGSLQIGLTVSPFSGGGSTEMNWGIIELATGWVCMTSSIWADASQKTQTCAVPTACGKYRFFTKFKSGNKAFGILAWGATGIGSMP